MWVAVDYGKMRVGLASADAGSLSVAPAGILRYPPGPYVKKDSFGMVINGIRDFLGNRNLEGIVLGDPGEEDEGSRYLRIRILELGGLLGEAFGVPVEFQDEAFSSREAEEALEASGRSRRGRRLDDLAACVILRRYLEGRFG